MINGYPIPASGHVADSLSLLTNPTMSAAKGRAYIDTIVNFVSRRIAVQFDYVICNVTPGFENLTPLDGQISVYPNPARSSINIELPVVLNQASLVDLTGKEIMTAFGTNSHKTTFDVSSISRGMYFIRVIAADGRAASKRVVIE
jgi:hypothetical protein